MSRRRTVVLLMLVSAAACVAEMTTEDPDACVNGTCDDGDPCNGAEVCDPSSGCTAGPALTCDDFDACTTDTCNSTSGCINRCTAADSNWNGAPCCVDEANWLMRCVAANGFPGEVSAYVLRVAFTGGSSTPNAVAATPAGWSATDVSLSSCPDAPRGDSRCPVSVPSGVAEDQAKDIDLICRTPRSITCAEGEKACALYDPEARAFVTAQFCAPIDTPLAGGVMGPAIPSRSTEFDDQLKTAYSWTSFELVDLMMIRGQDSCPAPDTANAPPAPEAECSAFETGSAMERCCSCCARNGGAFEANFDPVRTDACSCTGVSASCP